MWTTPFPFMHHFFKFSFIHTGGFTACFIPLLALSLYHSMHGSGRLATGDRAPITFKC